jgi:hypothetical protein
MAKRKRTTTDAVKILHNRYFKGDPKRLASLESEREKAAIAAQIYDLRNKASLTQKQLADLVGTTQSDYRGHTLSLLERIATALHCRVEVRLLPDKPGYVYA